MQPDVHDVVEAAGQYIWSAVETGKCRPLQGVMPPELVEPVRELLVRFVDGERLTSHRSGDPYEALRSRFRALWVA